jgi:hypothetical protein
MSQSKRDTYKERIIEKARTNTHAYTLKTIRRIVKENKEKSDKDIIKIFMKEL